MAKNIDEKIRCTSCDEPPKPLKEFFDSSSILYKRLKKLPICKSCVNDLYDTCLKKYKDEKTAIYEMCKLLDLPFYETAFNGAVKHSEKTNWKLNKSYFKGINSFKDNNSYGNCFADGEQFLLGNTEEINGLSDEINFDDFEVDRNIISFFGRGFEKEDYFVLMNEYEDWVTRYECDSKAMEDIIKQICLTNLDIQKRRVNGEKVDTQLKTLQDLLGSANLKPVQETGANATDQATFGTLIKKWENEHPIPEPLPEWKEKDIFQYVKVWFLGHLSKMVGLNNPYGDEYEEELIKHSVETPFEDGDDSGE